MRHRYQFRSARAIQASFRNLEKANAMRPKGYPRQCRTTRESSLIRRLAYQWYRQPNSSLRQAARYLGISHTHLRRLVNKFQADPAAEERYARNLGPGSFGELLAARAESEEQRALGLLRPLTQQDKQFRRAAEVRQASPYDSERAELEKRIQDWSRGHAPKND